MAYSLPDWIDLDEAQLRAECGLMPHQVESGADDTRLEEIITGHIATQTARVMGEARLAAGGLSFPSTIVELQKAFPVVVEFPVLHLWTASESAKQAALLDVKEDAYALWVPGFVSLSFPFVIGDPDDEENGQVIPTQEAIDAATTAAATDRANRIEEQKQLAMQAISSFVFAKLWYTTAPPDSEQLATATEHYKTAQTYLSALKKDISGIRAAYRLRACPFG